jgi:multiple sugar transport system permease protein
MAETQAVRPSILPGPAGRPDAAAWHPATPPLPQSRWRQVTGRDWALGWALLAPVVAIILALLLYPFIDAITLSFQERFIGKTGTWIGVRNYVNFFTNPNTHFVQAAINTVLMTAAAIAGKFVIGMAMACVLNQQIPARNVMRGLMFLPWAVPAVVSAYVWRFMFDTTGPINGAIARFHLRDDYVYFFNDARLALPALIAVIIWSGTPFWTMNFLAGMQSISQELYEAAEIDGASTFKRFLYVTLPSLQPVILVTALLSTIWTSANLTQIFVLTGGGPNYATVTLPLLAYLVAIPGKQLGAGAAISMTMMPAYLILVYFLTRRMLRQE